MSTVELLHDVAVQREILAQTLWPKLPPDVRAKLGNNERSWKALVIKWSLTHQVRWKSSLVRRVVADERAYYQEVAKYSRENLMLYPYHLSDVFYKGLQLTPFAYYREMMLAIMQRDDSYDVLPNFTAADAYRLLAIGRNEYINIMNEARAARSFSLFGRKKESQLETLLPVAPVAIAMQPCTLEHATIDMLLDCGATGAPASSIDRSIVASLYTKGLVWLDVPIAGADCVTLTSLEGFVMNRVRGDFMETMLYKIFVTLDERTPVAQLAEVLQAPEEDVRAAVSLFVRLGFAERIVSSASASSLSAASAHPSWSHYAALHGNDAGSLIRNAEALLGGHAASEKRIGFLYDSALTAFLMMGNLAEGLKAHAVTMYEVGKLESASLESFLAVLDTLELVGDQGEARRYFEHAITLRTVVRALWRRVVADGDAPLELDLLRAESLNALDRATRARVIQKGYAVLVSMCPLGGREPCVEPASGLPHYGPAVWEVNSPWWKLFLASLMGPSVAPPTHLYRKGERVRTLPPLMSASPAVRVTKWDNEAQIVSTASALALINDLLLASPVLVQVVSSVDPPTRHIPLPICAADAALNRGLALLARELQLDSVLGYVELLRDADGEWVPYDVLYGIPLFDAAVSQVVVDRMQANGLLQPPALTAHVARSTALAERLRQFIRSSGATFEPHDTATSLPLPT